MPADAIPSQLRPEPTPTQVKEPCVPVTIVESEVEIAGRKHRLRHPSSPDELLSEEDFDRDERLPYWAQIWPSARALADRVAQMSGAGRRGLELGCGLGVVSFAAAAAGFSVVASDWYDEALEFTADNALRNGLNQRIATRRVDWRNPPADLGQFDAVFAADVLYERRNLALVAAMIARSLAPNGRAWVSDPGRRVAADFPAACRQHGLTIVDEDLVSLLDGKLELVVQIYEIGLSSASA